MSAEGSPQRGGVGDVVYTPDWVVADMLAHFKPQGVVLDPCRGKGAFHNQLPNGSPWCEITDGRDFFDWATPVGWIVSNPPFSKSSAWFRHSFDLAEHVLYLLPLRHMFSAYGRLADLLAWGGVKEIRLYGGGSRVGFPMGNVVGAVHMARGYRGPTHWTDQKGEDAPPLAPAVSTPCTCSKDYLDCFRGRHHHLCTVETSSPAPDCHCGNPVAFGFDGDPTHHRGMCARCDSVRCDVDPANCSTSAERVFAEVDR